MFLSKIFQKVNNTVLSERPAYVYQLTAEEQEKLSTITLNIPGFGAVSYINKLNKEELVMVEKLKVYLAEVEAKVFEINNKDIEVSVKEELAKAEANIREQLATERDFELAKLEHEKEVINKLIEREVALAANAVVENAITEV